MNRLVIAGLLGGLALAGRAAAAEALPAADAVIQRLIARAQEIASGKHGPQYTYAKRSLTEELGAHGQTLKSEEHRYEVRLVAGFPFDRLVQIQGRQLTSAELQKEDEKEERFRQRVTGVNVQQKADQKEGWVTAPLVERYQFLVQERMTLRDRPTLVLAFRPKAERLPAKTIADKLLNRVAGTAWVDEAEADVARLSATLVEPISLGWFGLLGSLHRCELVMDRQRMPDGVWIVARQVLWLQGRRLASTFRVRVTEQASGFAPVAGSGPTPRATPAGQ